MNTHLNVFNFFWDTNPSVNPKLHDTTQVNLWVENKVFHLVLIQAVLALLLDLFFIGLNLQYIFFFSSDTLVFILR
jgi:hypothetical protein